MTKVFPQVRLLGDKDQCIKYVRLAKQEMFRLNEMYRTQKVPILQNIIEVNDYTTIQVQIVKGQEFIEINCNPPPPPVIKKEIPEEEVKPYTCPPAFVVYKNKEIDHELLLDFNRDGYILGKPDPDGPWRLATVENFEDAPNAGWYGLREAVKTFNDPSTHSVCDIVTWYGNPCSMCDDRIFTFGPYDRNERLIQKRFFYRGVRHDTPEYVLGACILAAGSTDYYYILTTDAGQTRFPGEPDNRLGGTDEVIYRKDITKAIHPTDDWEQVGTIPYTDYGDWETNYITNANAMWYMSIGTAYVDAEGIAWFTKVVVDSIPLKRRILLKVNLRTGAHEEVAGRDEIPYTVNENSYYNVVAGGIHATSPAPIHEESLTRTAEMNGEQYVYTMGGLEARYDLYVKVQHSDSVSTVTDHQVSIIDADTTPQWFSSITVSKAIFQSTKITLLIKKEDKEIWSGPLVKIEADSVGSFGPDSINPTPVVAGAQPVIQEQMYLFLHPHALKHTTWYQKDTIWGEAYEPHFSTVTMSFHRGTTKLHSFTGTVIGEIGQINSNVFDPTYRYQATFTTLVESSTGVVADQGIEDGRAPFSAGVYGTPGDSVGVPVSWPKGTVGMRTIAEGFNTGQTDIDYAATTSYGSASELHTTFGDDYFYQPEYMVVQRPTEKNGPWSYILCLQEIMDAGPSQSDIDIEASHYYSEYPFNLNAGAMEAKVKLEDDWFRAWKPLTWIQSNSWKHWRSGHSFVEGENTRHSESTEKSAHLWRCTSPHTASSLNAPGVDGAPWERFDPKVLFFSNVITEEKMKSLTGELYIDTMEMGIL